MVGEERGIKIVIYIYIIKVWFLDLDNNCIVCHLENNMALFVVWRSSCMWSKIRWI